MSNEFVQVQFHGICTRMAAVQSGLPNPAWGHRIVLVNGSQQNIARVPQLNGISPHIATMTVAQADILVGPGSGGTGIENFALHGVLLSVINGQGSLDFDQDSCLPHLADFVPSLPAPGPTTFASNRTLTSCYFDFLSGSLAPQNNAGGAVSLVLTVPTLGNPQITGIPFLLGGPAIALTLRSGALIEISNVPDPNDIEQDKDFLLHFLCCETFPPDATFPTDLPPCGQKKLQLQQAELRRQPPPNPGRGHRDGIIETTGPGCSNSDYP